MSSSKISHFSNIWALPTTEYLDFSLKNANFGSNEPAFCGIPPRVNAGVYLDHIK
jgi:hypothetical protein